MLGSQLNLLARGAAGVTIHRDWDALGQRATDSGSITFENVRSDPSWRGNEAGALPPLHASLRYQAGFAAVLIGIGAAAISAASTFVGEKSRPWPSAGVDNAADDPYVRRLIGELAADLAAAYAITLSTGDLLDAFERGRLQGSRSRPDLRRQIRGLARRRAGDLGDFRFDGHAIGSPRQRLRSVLAQRAHAVAARSRRLEKRGDRPPCADGLGPAAGLVSMIPTPAGLAGHATRIAIGLGLLAVATGALVGLAGANPFDALSAMATGAFGDKYSIAETLVQATPLAIVALGVTPAVRAGVFTVGAEGQLVAGAVAATAAIFALGPSAGRVLLLVGCLAGVAGGWRGRSCRRCCAPICA